LLKSISIPELVTTLELGCFAHCCELAKLTFESDVKLAQIGGDAFVQCFSLHAIAIPRSTQVIGASAFARCCSLSYVSFALNSKLRSIEFAAF
jgi:hypothetical protein